VKLKVMTFNLRINVPVDGPNQWTYRLANIRQKIAKHDADILMFQEVDEKMLQDLSFFFKTYDYYYQGRHENSLGEGCPIFVRKTMFQIIETDTIWLSHTPRKKGSMDPEEGYPRIASMVLLKAQHQLLRIVNCHLAHRSSRNKDLNLKVLFDYVISFNDSAPLLIGGDFNMEIKQINPYKPRRFAFALQTIDKNTYHEFNGGEGISQIDHFLYQDSLELDTICVDHIELQSPWTSDHYPVIGEFIIYES
jgi:endonuclease/exonuclease/phosphatase family metal-dependent hydrolase